MDSDLGAINLAHNINGNSIVATAAGLMLLPENASKLIRLRRLSALGVMIGDEGKRKVPLKTIEKLLKKDAIGGGWILLNEDPYSEVLVQSMNFFGGSYLLSPGVGEYTVADLENLCYAYFHNEWASKELQNNVCSLVKGLLIISDMMLKRAGLGRGTLPLTNKMRGPIHIPNESELKQLTKATFLSHQDLEKHGEWLFAVVDSLALDPGQLDDSSNKEDGLEFDDLYLFPFLRCSDGYQVILPLDLSITIRFHLLRLASENNRISDLGSSWRQVVLNRLKIICPDAPKWVKLGSNEWVDRYLLPLDDKRDIHVILATDPLVDWNNKLNGIYDTRVTRAEIEKFVSPVERKTYSKAQEILHLVVIDSPGRRAVWGIPPMGDSDLMLIVRSDDIEIMLHNEPTGLLGLFLFAQAVKKYPGDMISMGTLDAYSVYLSNDKSFYFSDDQPPTFMGIQPTLGAKLRQDFTVGVDRHGIVLPVSGEPIVDVCRSYKRGASEIYIIEPNSFSYIGFVIELYGEYIFIKLNQEKNSAAVGLQLAECVAYWIWECVSKLNIQPKVVEIELYLEHFESWGRYQNQDNLIDEDAVRIGPTSRGWGVYFTKAFAKLLREKANSAERELVKALLKHIFDVHVNGLNKKLDMIAPLGSKRIALAPNWNERSDMFAIDIPVPLVIHSQIVEQLLDDLGWWLRSDKKMVVGILCGEERKEVFRRVVKYYFERLKKEISIYDRHQILNFLIDQNEALIHQYKTVLFSLESKIACFGENSSMPTELDRDYDEFVHAQRANRFLIEYVAACPPAGDCKINNLDYLRLLAISDEIIIKGTISDLLHRGLANYQVSILESGRLGISSDVPIEVAMRDYGIHSIEQLIRSVQGKEGYSDLTNFDLQDFVNKSEPVMRKEFGFSFNELRNVCGALLDLNTADKSIRIDRDEAVTRIADTRNMSLELVSVILDSISLFQRPNFFHKRDDWPWGFNRDMSYTRRPVVRQGNDIVFGFRSIHNLVRFWVTTLLSGRFLSQAKTEEMKQLISKTRSQINNAFAREVSLRLNHLGIETKIAIEKFGGRRIVGVSGEKLGDIDILGVHEPSKTIVAIEAKDFEVSRTPSELANEVGKLFGGKSKKKSTVEKHERRLEWLREHLDKVVAEFGIDDSLGWKVRGFIVTSEQLVTPMMRSSSLPVLTINDLDLSALGLEHRSPSSKRKR